MKSREEILEFFSVGIETETDRIDYETLCKNHDVIFDKGWLGQFGYYGVNGKEGFYDMSSHIPIGHKFKSLQEFKEFLEKGEESEPTDLIAEARRRGYKAGDKITRDGFDCNNREVTLSGSGFIMSHGSVFCGGTEIYCSGTDVWAEIVSSESSPPASNKEIGKWYKDPYASEWMVNAVKVNGGKYEMHECYGFHADGMWTDSIEISLSGMIKATDDEIEKALITEAKKRGFKDGVEYHNFIADSEFTFRGNFKVERNEIIDKNNNTIFLSGKWATIISEPKTKTTYTPGEGEVKKEREMVLAENTVVHCPTEELAEKVLKIAHECGYKSTTDNVRYDNTKWNVRKDGTCYNFKYGIRVGWEKSYITNHYKIISAEQFLRDNGEFVWEEPSYLQHKYYAGIDPFGIIMNNSSTGRRHSISMHQGNLHSSFIPMSFKQEYPNTFEQSLKPNGKVELPTKKSKKKELNLSVKSDVKKINL